LLLSQVIIAVGSCTGFVGAGYIGGKWFGLAKFSFMFGLVQVVAALTSAFSQNLISLALSQVDWRALFNATAVFGVLLCILGAIYIRDPVPVANKAVGGIGGFFTSVIGQLAEVAKIGHVWIASLVGGLTFGAMLSLGVVWAPKLLKIHGLSESAATLGASMLWLGLAAGSALIPHWSDVIRRRKLPILLGTAVQLVVLLVLLYVPLGTTVAIALLFIFGFANASHMLAFSTAADVVQPSQIGTSAAIVNGIMFIFGGILISRPGVRIGLGLEQGIEAGTLEAAQFAGWPLLVALVIALVIALLMKETYPSKEVTK
jgi:predicted MFS family arabinose efflux permease